MARDDERRARARETPIVGSLPEAPGIIAAMHLAPGLDAHLNGLADELLVKDFAGATITRAERELLATAVSAGNDCFFCMDAHGAFASEMFERDGVPAFAEVVERVKNGESTGRGAKIDALLHVARVVQRSPRELSRPDVERAIAAGATDADTQLAVLIASAFCMFNRIVDGLRTRTMDSADAYREGAKEIADRGYGNSRSVTIPP